MSIRTLADLLEAAADAQDRLTKLRTGPIHFVTINKGTPQEVTFELYTASTTGPGVATFTGVSASAQLARALADAIRTGVHAVPFLGRHKLTTLEWENHTISGSAQAER